RQVAGEQPGAHRGRPQLAQPRADHVREDGTGELGADLVDVRELEVGQPTVGPRYAAEQREPVERRVQGSLQQHFERRTGARPGRVLLAAGHVESVYRCTHRFGRASRRAGPVTSSTLRTRTLTRL